MQYSGCGQVCIAYSLVPLKLCNFVDCVRLSDLNFHVPTMPPQHLHPLCSLITGFLLAACCSQSPLQVFVWAAPPAGMPLLTLSPPTTCSTSVPLGTAPVLVQLTCLSS